MDLETFANLFSGSPFKPLIRHRQAVLDALLYLNRQVCNLSSEQIQALPSTPWIKEAPRHLEKLEQEVLARIQRPSLTSQPKDVLINVLQTQSNLAHQIFRLSERLSYRPLRLPAEMITPMNNLSQQFGKTVYGLRQGIIELDELNRGGFRKQHTKILGKVRKELALYVDELRSTSHEIRDQACRFESDINPVDVALLFLILDDISDLSLWMRSMIIHLQAW